MNNQDCILHVLRPYTVLTCKMTMVPYPFIIFFKQLITYLHIWLNCETLFLVLQ